MNTNIKAAKKGAPKLNFFDVLIIILVAIALIVGGIFLLIRARQSTDTVSLQYTVVVKDLISDINIYLEPGQEVIHTVRLNSLGHVISHEIFPSTYNAYNEETGKDILGTYEDMNSVAIIIEATAVKANMSYEVNGVAISVGSLIYFRTPTFTGRGYVTALSVDGTPIVIETEAETTEEIATEETSGDEIATEELTQATSTEA